MGYADADLDKPIIGIANAWSTTVPGHYNLKAVAEALKEGIRAAGGTPVEFGVIGACDGIAEGHEGMRYILPTRDVIADSIELMVQAHQYDAGGAFGLLRQNSSRHAHGGGQTGSAGHFGKRRAHAGAGPVIAGRKADTTSIIEGVGRLKRGEISEKELAAMEEVCARLPAAPAPLLGTANTMCCIAEALGMSLPASAMIPAAHIARIRGGQRGRGRPSWPWWRQNLTARKIITRQSLENAVRLTSAIGGSTNAALHLPAIAYEAEVEFDIDLFDDLSRTTPLIAKMNPAASANVIDFFESGGVPSVMSEILPLLHGDCLTVTGRSLAEELKGVASPDNEVVKTFASPFSKSGGPGGFAGQPGPLTRR